VNETYDYQNMKREIAEDEKVSKAKPVLLTQREIRELLEAKQGKGERRRTP